VNYDEEAPYTPEIKSGVEDMARAIRPAAEAVVRNEADIDPAHYETAVNRYTQMIDGILEQAQAGGDQEVQTAAQEIQASISERGWINLGMWYYRILSVSATRSQSVQFGFDYTAPGKDSIYSELGGIAEYYNRSGSYVSKASSMMASDGDMNPVSQEDLYSDLSKTFTAKVMDILNTEGDPFLSMVNLGQTSFSLGAFLFGSGKALEFLPGMGKLLPGPTGAITEMVSKVGPVAAWIGGVLIVIGAWLGWYLPMLPFVTWVAGVIGVFIAIIQSLFASQIWAAAHAMPEGEGLAGTHAKQGYMLLITLALRPILIVMGFVFSYYILWAGCWLSIEGLKVYMTTITTGPISSFIGIFVGLLVAAILVTMILHRSLGFIFEAADDILTWIGGSRQLGSEQQSAQRAMGAFAMVINRGGTVRGLSGALKKGAGIKTKGAGVEAGITPKGR
jgi:conjugal transfer/type IV secretion protein DotA/TraY